MRRAVLAACCGAFALTASACETTQQESARLARAGAQAAAAHTVVALGGANTGARAADVTLLRGNGRTAVAVQLTNTAGSAQVDVPVLIDVKGATGASLYSNDIQGLQPSLQEMPLLAPGRPAWWVDDQVLVSGVPRSVSVRLGRARSRGSSALPAVTLRGAQLGSDAGGPFVIASAVNESAVAQPNMPVFAVALRRGRVVAAGRGLIPLLAGGVGRRASFQVYLVGDPKGARVQLTASPTALG
jgi:hypothetical protein